MLEKEKKKPHKRNKKKKQSAKEQVNCKKVIRNATL